MTVSVDPDQTVSAAQRLQTRATGAQGAAQGLGAVSGEAANADVAAGSTAFASGWATALNLAGEDLGVLQSKIASGARLYTDTDSSAANAAGASTPA